MSFPNLGDPISTFRPGIKSSCQVGPLPGTPLQCPQVSVPLHELDDRGQVEVGQQDEGGEVGQAHVDDVPKPATLWQSYKSNPVFQPLNQFGARRDQFNKKRK